MELADGDYDEEAMESCRECFDEIKEAVPLEDGQEVVRNYSCTEDQKKKQVLVSFGPLHRDASMNM